MLRLAGDWAPGTLAVEALPWADCLLYNLEGAFVPDPSDYPRLPKAGPHLHNVQLPEGPVYQVAALANNHLMDFGLAGLETTTAALDEAEYGYAGAGKTLADARRARVVDIAGTRVAVLSCCEAQFGVAGEHEPGVAPFDPGLYARVGRLKQEVDRVIVSAHAAAEMSPWPSPRRQEAWRALIEAGADVVHGHHAHVPQGWERYGEGLIFYGMGNFCASPEVWSDYPHALWSLVPRIDLAADDLGLQMETVVIESGEGGIRLRPAGEEESSAHHTYLDACNEPLADRALLEAIWQEVAMRLYEDHFAGWLGFDRNLVVRTAALQNLKSILPISAKNQPELPQAQRRHLLWHLLFACESHQDAIATALGVLGGAIPDRRSPEIAARVDKLMRV